LARPLCFEPYLLAKNWRRLLSSAATEEQIKAFREHERTGRPMGDDDFQKRLEKELGRVLRRQKPGPKKTERT
jgi:putative transposase